MSLHLGACQPGFRGIVLSISASGGGGDEASGRLIERIQELGFIPGGEVEVLHQAPFFGDPLAVRVRGAIIALRRHEANHVLVEEKK